jgi:hypothetical protein
MEFHNQILETLEIVSEAGALAADGARAARVTARMVALAGKP